LIEKLLLKRVGEEAILKHNILVGDASTFQGKERNIVFVSMVSAPNDFRKVTAKPFQQRFNVAFSRARDRTYLVRSISLDDLDPDDLKAKAIMHFRDPMKGSAAKHEKDRALCESGFEKEVYDNLVAEGYAVTPQVPVGGFRIDMVIEGGGDRRLAVELDGEKWHGPERWWADYKRQLTLERMGWTFWRCWGSDWRLNRSACLQDLKSLLDSLGIRPGNASTLSGEYTQHRVYESPRSQESEEEQTSNGLIVQPGDAVEVEFTEQEPPRRETYVISMNSHHTGNGVVGIDSPIGKVLLGAAVGDDLLFPDTNESIIVMGIFKGRDEPEPLPPMGHSPSAPGLSLH
jgi:very-short-patch-repair endonuclease